MQLGQPMQAEHPQWQKGSAHRFERNCWARSSALRHGTQPPPCVCSEGHPLDRSQTISLHFTEAPGISFQRTIVPTAVASTI